MQPVEEMKDFFHPFSFSFVYMKKVHEEKHNYESCELQLQEIANLIIVYWIAAEVLHC